MKAILYIGHGTRSKKGAFEAKAFLERVIAKVPAPIQEVSFIELTEPTIEEGFLRCIKKGATEIIVVPILLLAAGHMKKDIPEIIEALQADYPQIPVTIRNAFGVQEVILDAIAELIYDNAENLSKEDRILIVGRGSSDPGIHQAFGNIEKGLEDRLKIRGITSCFLAAANPKFGDGLQSALKKAKKRVIVVPYLLFSGLLLSEVNLYCRKQGPHVLLIEPLSRHKAMEKVVIQSAVGSVEKDAASIY